MDYGMFEQEACDRNSEESEQDYMERLFQNVFAVRKETGRRINDMMEPEFCECNAEERTLTLAFKEQDWMNNPSGNIQGGILTTAADMTMGMLARYCRHSAHVVTVQLSINFMSPLTKGTGFLVWAKAEKAGKRMIFLNCKIRDRVSGKTAVEATAVFM